MSAGRRVLIVDDEEDIRRFCGRALGAAGCETAAAAGPAEALRALEGGAFDLVLTDLAMPHPRDGTRLAEQVRKLYPATDVAVMTGYPALDTAIPALKNGACDYLIKPFEQEMLVSMVERCFEKRRLSGELARERALRQELSAAYSELQKVERLKESFLSRVNHELRTPLAPALMAIGTVESALKGTRGEKMGRILRASLERMQQTVEHVLLFAELQNGTPQFYRTHLSVEGLLRAVAENHAALCRERDISVTVRAGEGAEPIWGSPPLLENAFRQLFLNAVNFNVRGGKVEIEVAHEEDWVDVVFSDTGIGIPAEKLPRIFDGFYQAAEYLTRAVGGVGLGLAIVRRTVEAHGGSVVVQSGQGKGSRFRVRLPRRDAEVQAALKTVRRAAEAV